MGLCPMASACAEHSSTVIQEIYFPETLAFDDKDNIYVSSPNKLHKFNSDFTVMACVDNNFK